MSEMSVYDVSPNREKKVDLHVQYVRARTYKKVFAKIIDLLLLAVVGVLLFVATRATVQAFPAYQNIQERINTTLEDSGIYVKNGDDLIDSVDYYNSKKDDLSSSALMNQVEGVINKFYSYVDTLVTKGDIRNEDYQKMHFKQEEAYSSLYFMNIKTTASQLSKQVAKIFRDQNCGNVFRIKGFINDDNWLELNATRHEIAINSIKQGQEIIIVIGENLNHDLIEKYLLNKVV